MNINKLFFFLTIVITLNMVILANANSKSLVQSTLPLTDVTPNQCADAIITFHIGIDPTGRKYNESSLNAPKNTCIKIILHNTDIKDHTFRIDADATNVVYYFNLYTNPGETNSSNFLTPNKAMSIQYYCAEPNHKANGMVGTLIISNLESSSSSNSNSITGVNSSSISSAIKPINASSGFEAFYLLISLFGISTIIIQRKKQ